MPFFDRSSPTRQSPTKMKIVSPRDKMEIEEEREVDLFAKADEEEEDVKSVYSSPRRPTHSAVPSPLSTFLSPDATTQYRELPLFEGKEIHFEMTGEKKKTKGQQYKRESPKKGEGEGEGEEDEKRKEIENEEENEEQEQEQEQEVYSKIESPKKEQGEGDQVTNKQQQRRRQQLSPAEGKEQEEQREFEQEENSLYQHDKQDMANVGDYLRKKFKNQIRSEWKCPVKCCGREFKNVRMIMCAAHLKGCEERNQVPTSGNEYPSTSEGEKEEEDQSSDDAEDETLTEEDEENNKKRKKKKKNKNKKTTIQNSPVKRPSSQAKKRKRENSEEREVHTPHPKKRSKSAVSSASASGNRPTSKVKMTQSNSKPLPPVSWLTYINRADPDPRPAHWAFPTKILNATLCKGLRKMCERYYCDMKVVEEDGEDEFTSVRKANEFLQELLDPGNHDYDKYARPTEEDASNENIKHLVIYCTG